MRIVRAAVRLTLRRGARLWRVVAASRCVRLGRSGRAKVDRHSSVDKSAFIHACREGGGAIERALRELDRTFFAQLHRECVRVVRDADVAFDLVQETFIKVWRRCGTYRGDAELLSWMRVILRRTILDRLRRSAPEANVEPARLQQMIDAERATPGAETASADEGAHRAELQAVFERCWRRFREAAPAHAAVLAWVVDDGLTHEDIAHLLERSPGATREFISQCRKRARVHFAEWRALAFGDEGTT